MDSEPEKKSDNERNAKSKKIKKNANILKNIKMTVSPPPIPAPSNYMVWPETIRRQHTKQPEKPRPLNILVSEPSKQSHINVFGLKKEKYQKETNKTVELQEKLKSLNHETQHIIEQIGSSCSMKNIVQEQEMCEAQKDIEFLLQAIDKKTTMKDVGVDNHNQKIQMDKRFLVKRNISSSAGSFSPLKSYNQNNY